MAKALEMKVLVHTRTKHEGLEKKLGFKYANDLKHLLSESHVVSLHVPLNNQTKDIVNNQFLADIMPEAIIINTADSGLVNESDLGYNFDKNKSLWYACDQFKD